MEHFDVAIVGAGISGIGIAYHLKQRCPDKSFVVLDGLKSFGGTWATHRYPGIRSDSDLNTYGYSFKPWTGPAIATAAEILDYMGEVIQENDLARHIRYQHSIASAKWSSKERLWTIEGVGKDTGAPFRLSCNFLSMCQGYYRHAEGYTPQWDGMADFAGRIVHTQHWPQDLEYKGKEVLVIGSGSTMSTLVPAITDEARHVTVLQRSPTFYFPVDEEDDLAEELRRLDIDEAWIHEILRRRRIYRGHVFAQRAAADPETVRHELIEAVRHQLPAGYDLETHFTPRYRPWHQRIARVPNGDFFASIRAGRTTMVTDEIERFTKHGLVLKSGRELAADIVVAATGLNLCVFGDIAFSVDGQAIDFADTVTYRGMMFTGVPNMAWVFGYFRASWTLRVDLVGEFVCRLLRHMDQQGYTSVVPALKPDQRDMPLSPWVAPEDFNPNYVRRSLHLLPKSGAGPEWRHSQDYWQDKDLFPAIDLEDPVFVYR